MKKKMIAIAVLCIGIGTFSTAVSEQIGDPIEFHPGETARSEDVNQNFKKVYDEVNKIGGAISVDEGTGRVTIGTTAPTHKLNVEGGIKADAIIADGLHIPIESGTFDALIANAYCAAKFMPRWPATVYTRRIRAEHTGNCESACDEEAHSCLQFFQVFRGTFQETGGNYTGVPDAGYYYACCQVN